MSISFCRQTGLATHIVSYTNGRKTLRPAAEGGHLDVVERLLVGRADVNAAAATNGSRTASQAAAEDGHLDVVERLRQAGAT